MKRMTEDNARSAFAGESQAHMRYLIYADRAEREGRPHVARLFRAISFAEQVHATNHLNALAQVGNTAQNLAAAVAGETYEVEEMYPAYRQVAEAQGEKRAFRSFDWAWQAEKGHAQLYQQAKEAVERSEDFKMGVVSICDVCGYTVLGEPPEKCPICNALRDRFRSF